MGFLSKIFKGVKKGIKGIFKGIKKVVKPIGKALKAVMKPFGKIANKLGPIGTMALMFIAPYALPAIWGAFGTWAAGLTGPMAGMMQGIHTAGMAVGKAYTTVTGFISDTVGRIASNTIGKIPLGADRTVGSVFTNFKNNMAMRLEGRNLKYGNNIVSESGVKSNGFLQADKIAGQNSQIVNDSLSQIQAEQIQRSVAFGDKLQAGVLDITKAQPTISSGGLNLPKLEMPSLPTFEQSVAGIKPEGLLTPSAYTEPTERIVVGLDHKFETANLPASDRLATAKKTLQPTKLDYLTGTTVDVPVSVLKANPQLGVNNDALVSYMNDVNGFANPFIGDKAEPFSRTAKLTGAVAGDLTKAATAIDQFQGVPTEPQPGFNRSYDPSLALSMGRVQDAGLADYSADFSNLANTYSAAGYGSATDYSSAQSQYSAGAYGGAGFMSQVSARFLQPTIGMPRIG